MSAISLNFTSTDCAGETTNGDTIHRIVDWRESSGDAIKIDDPSERSKTPGKALMLGGYAEGSGNIEGIAISFYPGPTDISIPEGDAFPGAGLSSTNSVGNIQAMFAFRNAESKNITSEVFVLKQDETGSVSERGFGKCGQDGTKGPLASYCWFIPGGEFYSINKSNKLVKSTYDEVVKGLNTKSIYGTFYYDLPTLTKRLVPEPSGPVESSICRNIPFSPEVIHRKLNLSVFYTVDNPPPPGFWGFGGVKGNITSLFISTKNKSGADDNILKSFYGQANSGLNSQQTFIVVKNDDILEPTGANYSVVLGSFDSGGGLCKNDKLPPEYLKNNFFIAVGPRLYKTKTNIVTLNYSGNAITNKGQFYNAFQDGSNSALLFYGSYTAASFGGITNRPVSRLDIPPSLAPKQPIQPIDPQKSKVFLITSIITGSVFAVVIILLILFSIIRLR